jgi:DTW domain-containing protein YfiP
MLLEHPALAALPRLALDAPAPTRYRAIRAARRADQVSTLEATVQALAMLEPTFDVAPLLDAFGRFVDGVAARQWPAASASVRQSQMGSRAREHPGGPRTRLQAIHQPLGSRLPPA